MGGKPLKKESAFVWSCVTQTFQLNGTYILSKARDFVGEEHSGLVITVAHSIGLRCCTVQSLISHRRS